MGFVRSAAVGDCKRESDCVEIVARALHAIVTLVVIAMLLAVCAEVV